MTSPEKDESPAATNDRTSQSSTLSSTTNNIADDASPVKAQTIYEMFQAAEAYDEDQDLDTPRTRSTIITLVQAQQADLAEIKRHLRMPFVLEHYGHEPDHETNGKLHYFSPLRDENRPSLDVFMHTIGNNADPEERFGDFGDSSLKQGDVFDLVGLLSGLTQPGDTITNETKELARSLLLRQISSGWDGPTVTAQTRASLDANNIEIMTDLAVPLGFSQRTWRDTVATRPGLEGADAVLPSNRVFIDPRGDVIVFLLTGADGEVIGARTRWPLMDGESSQRKSAVPGTPNVLMRMEAPTTKPVILTEGETDTWAAWGALHEDYEILGVPGVGNLPEKVAGHELDGRDILITFDGDPAGQNGARTWQTFLRGRGCNARIIPMPEGKDVSSLTVDQIRALPDSALDELPSLDTPTTEEFPSDAIEEAQAVMDGLTRDQRQALREAYDREAVAEAKEKLDELKAPPAPHRTLGAAELRELPEAEWVLEGFLPAQGVAQFIAESGIGKTYMWLSIGEAIASGDTDIAGVPITIPGRKVRYLAYESEASIPGRVRGIELHRGRDWPDNFRFWLSSESDRPLALDTPSGIRELRSTLDAEGCDEGLALLIIDTQALALPTTDENSNDDWNRMIGGLKKLAADYGCAIVLVGHPGHNGNRARGNSSQKQSVDADFVISGNHVKIGKSRRSEGNRPMFGIDWATDIEIGRSRSGAPVTERVFTPTAPKLPSVEEIRNDAYAYDDRVPELLQQYHEENDKWPSRKDDAARFIVEQLGGSLRKAKAALADAKAAGTVSDNKSSTGEVEWRPTEA